jgi:MucR family transcriptional regulator, transcriptional regulator of exopolysaccharide biosynthesis
MASDALKLTAQIVISHISVSVLKPGQLVEEIQDVYRVLSSLEAGVVPEIMAPKKADEAVEVKKPSIPLKDIVTGKHVVCLECGKKFRTLRAHIKKAHGLTPKEYFKRFSLDPKKYPLVCKEYSDYRRKLAAEKGLAAGMRERRKKAGA